MFLKKIAIPKTAISALGNSWGLPTQVSQLDRTEIDNLHEQPSLNDTVTSPRLTERQELEARMVSGISTYWDDIKS